MKHQSLIGNLEELERWYERAHGPKALPRHSYAAGAVICLAGLVLWVGFLFFAVYGIMAWVKRW